MNFSNSLIQWYLENKRDLPWRNTNNPYLIWLSEIILQQTRVAQGLPYYIVFITKFPTVIDLANASEQDVLKTWQGLGYYSRARNLHETAKFIASELKGVFPSTFIELKKLKGIGDYTAAAIASFAYNEPVSVLDGNVYRVLARFFGVEEDISNSSSKKVFQSLAQEQLNSLEPNLHNQAIMEFGALQCMPKKPNCTSCPLNQSCFALQKNRIQELPLKTKKTKVINKYFTYLMVQDSSKQYVVKKRIEKGIWQNLYDFPLIESENSIQNSELRSLVLHKFSNFTISKMAILKDENIMHKLSHQILNIQFVALEIEEIHEQSMSIENIFKLPFPIVLYNFMERFFTNKNI